MTSNPRRAVLLGVLCLTAATPLLAQPTQVKPGFNIFSDQQDVDDGRRRRRDERARIDAFPREFESADEDDQVEEGREEDRVANDREQ